KRPRWHVHFTPTGASWINQVERFFALITDKQIRRGIHRSTQAHERDIRAFIDAHNADPRPFRWTKGRHRVEAQVWLGFPPRLAGGISGPVSAH
ncbi:MAG: hypothetical protein JWP20_458, partial [Roseomonas sp.]|nr:hypothetical protein [Roseomonas sp.]